jgi:hypothetical protein
MSITYQDIVSVLCNKNKFSTNLNIMKFSEQFNYFNNLFDNSFYRYGIYNFNNEYKNISFVSSILYCIDDNYFTIEKDELFNKINSIYEYIKNIENIVEYLNINIIIFDFKENKIKSLYNGEYFNPYKETILLANCDDDWEPICCKDCKSFNINSNKSNILKNKILNKEITYYNDDKIFTINDNAVEITDDKFNKNEIVNDDSFTTKNTIYSNLTQNKLNKMVKGDIISIINDLNIDISELKKPTKIILIDLILNN